MIISDPRGVIPKYFPSISPRRKLNFQRKNGVQRRSRRSLCSEGAKIARSAQSASIRRNLEETQRQRKCTGKERHGGWKRVDRGVEGTEGALGGWNCRLRGRNVGEGRTEGGKARRGSQGRTRGWSWAPDDLKRSCDYPGPIDICTVSTRRGGFSV